MAIIQVPPDSTGKRVDTVTLTDATVEVHRQKMVVTGGSGTAEVVVVTNAAPAAGDMGLVTRLAGTASVALAAGTNAIGVVNVSAMPAAVLTSGTITAAAQTVVVSLDDGQQAVGMQLQGTWSGQVEFEVTLDNTVWVARNVFNVNTGVLVNAATTNGIYVGNFAAFNAYRVRASTWTSGTATYNTRKVIAQEAFNLGSSAAPVNVIGNINVSATATVAGIVGLTAGTAVIGDLNAISRTVQVAIATPFTLNNVSATVTVAISTFRTAADVPSASRGPRCVTASTSANVSFIAAPGAGLAIYITSLAASNAGAVGSRARVGSSATPGNVTMFMASAGGGFVMQFEPPWQLSANEALLCSVKPNTSDGLFNVHFFVASADAF